MTSELFFFFHYHKNFFQDFLFVCLPFSHSSGNSLALIFFKKIIKFHFLFLFSQLHLLLLGKVKFLEYSLFFHLFFILLCTCHFCLKYIKTSEVSKSIRSVTKKRKLTLPIPGLNYFLVLWKKCL